MLKALCYSKSSEDKWLDLNLPLWCAHICFSRNFNTGNHSNNPIFHVEVILSILQSHPTSLNTHMDFRGILLFFKICAQYTEFMGGRLATLTFYGVIEIIHGHLV